MKRLTVASTNPGKVREVRMALGDLAGWSVEALPEHLPDIEETGRDFIANAALKALHYSRLLNGLAVADDSGLCVDALGGRPGLHSARYAPTAEARNRKLLAELEAAGAVDAVDRGAAFYCALAVADRGKLLWTVQTELRGVIAAEPAGSEGFGYDPIFYVPELRQTLAELTADAKNRISARGQALARLRIFLTES